MLRYVHPFVPLRGVSLNPYTFTNTLFMSQCDLPSPQRGDVYGSSIDTAAVPRTRRARQRTAVFT